MVELSDYEISQIERYVKSFNERAITIQNILTRNNFSDSFNKAQSKLKEYVRSEHQGLKEAEKIIETSMSGSGFFSKSGLEKILSDKTEECSKEINEILTDYSNLVASVLSGLPRLDDISSFKNYSQSEYSGDKCYDIRDFSSEEKGEALITTGALLLDETIDDSDVSENVEKSESENVIFEATDSSSVETKADVYLLGIGAISDPNLKRIKLTEVREIKANAFKGTNSLEIIIISHNINKINNNAFRNIGDKCIIAFEDDKNKALSCLDDEIALSGKKVIFSYKKGDENLGKASLFAKEAAEPAKRIVINKGTALDNDEIKRVFIERNYKYSLNLAELNEGIKQANSTTDKELISYYALIERRNRALADNSYWDYANTMQHALKIAYSRGKIEDSLSIIFALMFLDSSGYRMINGKYNPFKQDPSHVCYHPKMEFGTLYEIITKYKIDDNQIENLYRNSNYVDELVNAIKDPYYSLNDSIKLMFMALKNPGDIFYPAYSGIKRMN